MTNSARIITASLDDTFPLSRLPAELLAESENLHPVRRQQWRAGRALLAEALFAFSGQEMLPEMQISARGKPSFTDPSLPQFSLSHSVNSLQLVLCAAGETGGDVEQIRPRARYLDVARQAFSETEFCWLTEQENPLNAFWQLWCLREAWLKQQAGSVWQMERIRLDPAAGQFSPESATDSKLWWAAGETVMSAMALPACVTTCEEYIFDARNGSVIPPLIPRKPRRWSCYSQT
ncbi:4'-phosphopantetheinyl transferase superfamily protein [Rahnella sp. PD12R]|uniref:4'-phosphopantetheinyl transferase superfamily protein n=1 Tax=Rahnella sp. PD12R TaxID=2855688 RepID=UPI001C4901C8|nr:4'-phosphopantetheinyl transferase superfamily protein [Rahnella sp. PD12R]MBV6821248.1 4'-phosphopantetheinyl transferase superfamily protein [Rahnella sp. PD12R]